MLNSPQKSLKGSDKFLVDIKLIFFVNRKKEAQKRQY